VIEPQAGTKQEEWEAEERGERGATAPRYSLRNVVLFTPEVRSSVICSDKYLGNIKIIKD
jgi:hypothetical protein